MGAWGPGPFDNDTAADFAHTLRAADVQQRREVLLDVLRTPVNNDRVLRPVQTSEYELDYQVEAAVAAVAYVADTIQDRCHHTDNAFARGVADDADATLLPPMELPDVDDELLATTLTLLDWLDHRLVLDDAGNTFARELEKLRADLVAPTEPR